MMLSSSEGDKVNPRGGGGETAAAQRFPCVLA